MNTFRQGLRRLGWTVLAAAAASPAAEPAAYVRRDGDEVHLGNAFLELRLTGGAAQGAVAELTNKLSGRRLPVSRDEFVIGLADREPLRRTALRFRDLHEQRANGLQTVTATYDGPDPAALSVAVVWSLRDDQPFARRHLELTTATPLDLRQVDAWVAGLAGTCSVQGFGQPVVLDDLFAGLEFPGAHNGHADGVLTLTQYPGRTVQGRWASKPVVLGVAEPGRALPRFHRYIDSLAAATGASPLFVNYNTWWTLMPPTEANCLALIRQFKERLFDPYGESFDTFTIDDGWDDKESIWRIRQNAFPNGFAPLAAALREMNAHLGLWLSPSSGYGHAPWGGRNGYEQNSNPWFLCQSGPRYRQEICRVVTDLARTHDLAFYKFDGFCPSCETEGHGHLPGPYAQEANIDAYTELLVAARQARPGIYLDPTCGIWLSPWWLAYADSLWGSVSGDYPDAIVPGPVVRDSATTTRDAVFRQRCGEYPAFPTAAIEHLGIIVISDEKWEDNAMAVVGRGCRLLTLYVNPAFFRQGDADWAFLASVLKWTRANAVTLGRTELVPGDPYARQPYGFAHFRGRRGILSLRNPFVVPASITVALDDSLGWDRAEALPGGDAADAFVARTVYPRSEVAGRVLRYGDRAEFALQGYEQLTVEVEPLSAAGPLLLGGRVRETGRAGRRATYKVAGRPGSTVSLRLPALPGALQVTADGQPLAVTAEAGAPVLSVPFAGAPAAACTVEQAQLAPAAAAAGGPGSLQGRATVTVPDGARSAVLHLLVDPGTGEVGRLRCTATVDAAAAAVRTVETPERASQVHPPHPWTWFAFDLPAGRHQVDLSITPAADVAYCRLAVGGWVCCESDLTERTVVVEADSALPAAAAGPVPVPLGQQVERETVTVFPLATVRLGTRWPAGDATVVSLDTVTPDEATQDWGKLRRNQSVWEKDLVIAGQAFTRGLGTHANGRLLYDLDGGRFRRFRCRVGRDEHADNGRITFQVRLDGKVAFDSGPMTRASPAQAVDIDVTGARQLELVTGDGGDGISGDHGDWVEADLQR